MRAFLSALILAAASTTAGGQTVTMKLDPASSVRVEGTSNIHDWHAVSTELTADITVAAPVASTSRVESVRLTLPVTSLKSGKGGLDKNMYKAMNAPTHPTITFVMQTYTSVEQAGSCGATITGLLTVNGVEKPISAEAVITVDARGTMNAVGSTSFRMTEFGIKPVTALMGTIRTADLVTIKFDLSGAVAAAVANLDR